MAPQFTMKNDEITTILGKGSKFEGKLTFEGTVRIDGDFSGEIETDGGLIIGETAEVEAQVRAGRVVVEGQVRGDLSASTDLEVRATARVQGNVMAPSLSVDRGAIIQGQVRMVADSSARAPAAPPDRPVAQPAN